MRELAAQDLPNERKLLPKAEAIDLYKKTNQVFKCELVEEKATEPMVSFYTTGKFIDFCRGPHIPSTKRIQAFKLMSVAGAYWKAKKATRNCSGFMRWRFSHKKSWMNICIGWKRRSGAIIESLERSWNFSACRKRPGRD